MNCFIQIYERGDGKIVLFAFNDLGEFEAKPFDRYDQLDEYLRMLTECLDNAPIQFDN